MWVGTAPATACCRDAPVATGRPNIEGEDASGGLKTGDHCGEVESRVVAVFGEEVGCTCVNAGVEEGRGGRGLPSSGVGRHGVCSEVGTVADGTRLGARPTRSATARCGLQGAAAGGVGRGAVCTGA